VAWGAADAAARWRLPKWAPAAAGVAVLAGCAAATTIQVRYWATSETVFAHAASAVDDNWIAENNLAVVLRVQGRTADAVAHAREAVRLKPNADTCLHLAEALLAHAPSLPPAEAHRAMADAEQACTAALGIRANFAEGYVQRGLARVALGKAAEAIADYQEAIRLKPAYAEAHTNLGNLWRILGKIPDALEEYQAARRIAPESPEVHNNLAVALAESGKTDEAIPAYRRAIELRPDYAEAHHNLGAGLVALGQLDEGLREYHEALRINPNYADAYLNLTTTLIAHGRPADAILTIRAAEAIPRVRDALAGNPRWQNALRLAHPDPGSGTPR
jgi:protein O-GlcNAc transferase